VITSENLPSAACVSAKLLRHLSVLGSADEAFCPSDRRGQIGHWARRLGAPPAPKEELNWQRSGRRQIERWARHRSQAA
jgi:hypothetical protein